MYEIRVFMGIPTVNQPVEWDVAKLVFPKTFPRGGRLSIFAGQGKT